VEKLHRNGKVQKVTEVVSAKPALGLPLGNCKLTFRYIDQSAIEFEGFISDITGLFVNPDIQADFKRVIVEEINYLKANYFKPIEPEKENETLNDGAGQESQETEQEIALAISTAGEDSKDKDFQRSALQKAIQSFRTFNFMEACRVLLLESGATNHLILQVGRLELLTSYANHIDHSQWTLMRGLKYDFLADGAATTLPHRQRLRELGEVYVHVFIPEDHKHNSKVDFKALNNAKPLLSIVPFIPGVVDIDQTLKSMKNELDSKEDALKLATERLSVKATRNDSAKIAVAGFEEYDPDDSGVHIRFDFTDALIIGAPTTLCAAIANSFVANGWVGGLGLGFILGCFLVSRRK
jgi:hypothetical protein